MVVSELDPNASERPDPRIVRRRANRTAASFDAHDAVHREIAARLLEHLDPVRLTPRRVLELGCATGRFTRALAQRYRSAEVLAVDFARARVAHAVADRKRFRERRRWLCADAGALPLPDRSVDLVCANLLVHWLADPSVVMAECARVLRHGGLLAFSALGPDTLHELRPLVADSQRARLHRLADMHYLADIVVRAGFSDVVADMEVLRAPYRGPGDLAQELRRTGSTYSARTRASGLDASASLRRLLARDDTPSLEVSFEVIYVHGWFLDRQSVPVQLPGS